VFSFFPLVLTFLTLPEAAAEALYHHIDNLELYVGLQAEQAKEPMPGAGLCPGFTISRAILADAVALTRGDRFLTTDNTRMRRFSLLSDLPS
jgi:Animal haem peroxidase